MKTPPITNNDPWIDNTWQKHPAFSQCDKSVITNITQCQSWPAVNTYNDIFPNAPITFVEQNTELIKAIGGYERFIEEHNAIPTRPQNIHDFMNALSWHHFPQSKLSLHKLQSAEYKKQSQSPHNKRSPLQNACTLFDECGVIFITERTDIMKAICEHKWHDLFIAMRSALISDTRIAILGHALLEKCLNPYIGMCGNAFHLHLNPASTVHEIDTALAKQITTSLGRTEHLYALPILGYPNWHPDNENAAFYENTHYFRPLTATQAAN